MKSNRILKIITCWTAVVIALSGAGCTYNVDEPLWDKPAVATDSVTITSVDPVQATAGYNYITIYGQNFGRALDTTIVHNVAQNTDTSIIYNGIYINGLHPEIVSFSPTAIRVRRPNLASDTCTVKIMPDNTELGAKYGPYRITSVYSAFGGFVSNAALSTITMDKSGNLYVEETATGYLWKVTQNGQATQIGGSQLSPLQLDNVPSDAKVISDSLFYFMVGAYPANRYIRIVNLNAGVQIDSFSVGKRVTCGDLDSHGYLYAGGIRDGIVVVRPDRSYRSDGYYTQDTILSVRVFSGYLYVALRTGLWRHSLADTSLIGSQESVLDWTSTAYASLPIRSFAFSSDGSKLYIGTNSQYPIIVANVTGTLPIPAGQLDIMYKDILPAYCRQLAFGDALYMISGNAQSWNVYRIDVGTTGAPYY